ncbi:hypothetical protein PGT21_016528 [Puccinia graminis f. sp. tritici]|uniref:Uncharacterized protein n=1 Tax=Puccinia graminis f. sp. tritici TaxID=56615 RepID=A0A5B0ML42_PUCGR|nr:hypothetical protein PGT21_016528 [Puccinia graminis f. sp. tritici]
MVARSLKLGFQKKLPASTRGSGLIQSLTALEDIKLPFFGGTIFSGSELLGSVSDPDEIVDKSDDRLTEGSGEESGMIRLDFFTSQRRVVVFDRWMMNGEK